MATEKQRQLIIDYPLLSCLKVLCPLIPWAPSLLAFLSHLRLELCVCCFLWLGLMQSLLP